MLIHPPKATRAQLHLLPRLVHTRLQIMAGKRRGHMRLAHLMSLPEETPPWAASCPVLASMASPNKPLRQHMEDTLSPMRPRPLPMVVSSPSTASRSQSRPGLEAIRSPSHTIHLPEPSLLLGALVGLPLGSHQCSWVPELGLVYSSHSSFHLKFDQGL